MFSSLLFPILALTLISCGAPESPKKSDFMKDSKNKLEVGTHFLNAPTNWISFGPVKKGKKYTKKITFAALNDGTLRIGDNTTALGSGCKQGEEETFDVNYKFFVKSKGSSDYRTVPQIYGYRNPTIDLGKADMLRLEISVVSLSTCTNLEMALMAIYE